MAKARNRARVFEDMITFHPEQDATEIIMRVYFRMWHDLSDGKLLPLGGKKKDVSTKELDHPQWTRTEFVKRLIAYNNSEAARLAKHVELAADDVPNNLLIESEADFRNKDKHGGLPRVTQLFNHGRQQLILQTGVKKDSEAFKTIKGNIHLPPVKGRRVKQAVDFFALYNEVMQSDK